MNSVKRQPERTCIGCRGVFTKDEVVRIVAGPDGIVIDYREKLPGRAAYSCPNRECIKKALMKEGISRALHTKVRVPDTEDFIQALATAVREKIKALIAMSAKAGKLAAGYSAVQDALEKGRLEMMLYAQDLSEGTKEKIGNARAVSVREATLFTRDELGKLLNRELVGVIGVLDKGFADAIWKEIERLRSLQEL